MEEDVHRHDGKGIEVSYDVNRCIHVRACVEGLPDVFDPDRRPWIDADGADPDEVAAVIERCPTGALQYERTDGDVGETPPERNAVVVAADGPLYVRGDVELRTPDGRTVLEDTRIALCRCGRSENKPLCDGSHAQVFEADGVPPADVSPANLDTSDGSDPDSTDADRLVITLTEDGPLVVDGSFVLRDGDDDPRQQDGAALCRCGASANKPFCDGSHDDAGFTTGDGE
jgi:CDGSH-type Zn-finger protein/uncharacterized Fe-S cluster protein YjdI